MIDKMTDVHYIERERQRERKNGGEGAMREGALLYSHHRISKSLFQLGSSRLGKEQPCYRL